MKWKLEMSSSILLIVVTITSQQLMSYYRYIRYSAYSSTTATKLVNLFNEFLIIYCRYINDCRNPAGYNVSFDKRSDEGCAYVIANRDIMVGEELFVDYGRWYWLNSKPIRLSFCALQTFRGKAGIPHLGLGSLSVVD